MKRRKIVRPRDYLKKVRPGAKKITRKGVGQVFARLRGSGRVCSAPVTTPPSHETVWVRRTDPHAPLMQMAAERAVVTGEVWEQFPGLPADRVERVRRLTDLGIAAVPAKGGRIRMIGTDLRLARIVNHIYHGRRRRRLDRREVIDAVFGLWPDGRATSVTDRRLEYALTYFAQEFGPDLSDLIDHESVLI